MKTKHVSVIIPAYNAAAYLSQAIESVLAQTYRDFEIIVIDDGSTDNTLVIAHQFGDSIRYIYQTNQGLSAARNTGIRNSEGKIVALLDADDLWDSEYLELLIDYLNQHPEVGGVYCGYQYIDPNGKIVGNHVTKIVAPHLFYETLIRQGNWLVPSAVIAHKELVVQVGLFDESISPVADLDMWIKLSAISSMMGIPKVLVKYRCHENNMSKKPDLMVAAKSRLLQKLFGAADGDPSQWSENKRYAYSGLFLSGTSKYLAYGDATTSFEYFLKLLHLSPDTVTNIGFWRGIARVHIPLEFQNDPAKRLDWERSQKNVLKLLDMVSASIDDSPQFKGLCCKIKSNAFLGLADEAGRNAELQKSCSCLWKAVQYRPQIAFSRPYWGTMARSIFYWLRLFLN